MRGSGTTDALGESMKTNTAARPVVAFRTTTPAGEIVAGPFYSRSEAYRAHTQLAAGDLAPFPSW